MHSIDDLLPHAPLHCAATGEMVKGSFYLTSGPDKDDIRARSYYIVYIIAGAYEPPKGAAHSK